MLASENGHEGAVRALLGAGAAVDLKEDYTGHTALMCAGENGRAAVVRVLLEAGGNQHATSFGLTHRKRLLCCVRSYGIPRGRTTTGRQSVIGVSQDFRFWVGVRRLREGRLKAQAGDGGGGGERG